MSVELFYNFVGQWKRKSYVDRMKIAAGQYKNKPIINTEVIRVKLNIVNFTLSKLDFN